MAEILLFHHAQGQTQGVLAFADQLRQAGHVVHAPDLYQGRSFATLEAGIAYARELGFDTLLEMGCVPPMSCLVNSSTPDSRWV